MALTTAMRTPVNTVGIANGNSTIRMRYGLLMPMAASGFLYAGIDLLQSQAGIADDGQKRVKCDACNHSDFSGSEKDHNDA